MIQYEYILYPINIFKYHIEVHRILILLIIKQNTKLNCSIKIFYKALNYIFFCSSNFVTFHKLKYKEDNNLQAEYSNNNI